MMKRQFGIQAASALMGLMLIVLGCGKKEPAQRTDASPKDAAKEIAQKPTATAANPPSLPTEPDKMMLALSQGINDGDFRLLWMALPASYQKDVNALVSEFANKMDKDLWNKGFSILGKVAKVAATQKEFILGSKPFFESTEADQKKLVAENWDGTVDVLTYLATCELAKLENLRAFDGSAFIASMVERANKMDKDKIEALVKSYAPEQAQMDLTNLKVETIKGDDKSVTLQLSLPDDDKKELVMVRVEDRWIPEEMADGWTRTIDDAQKSIAALSGDEMTRNKPKILAMMAMIESGVDQLSAAKTQAEFDTILVSLLQTFTS